jgi:hypothetical protein
MILVGPSMSGKTTFTKKLLDQLSDLVEGQLNHIYYCCPNLHYAPKVFTENPKIKVIEGLPNINEDIDESSLLILDDFMLNLGKEIAEIFTVSCHHKNISVILTVQNLFHRGCPSLRDISLNAQHIVLFKTLRDIQQIACFLRQVYPHDHKNILKVYKDVTSIPYSYLLFDFSQKCNDLLRIKTNIFNNGKFFECYSTEPTIKQNSVKEETSISKEPLLSCITFTS